MPTDPTFTRERDTILEEWRTLLSFPSISTDPAYDDDCLRCAEWLKAHLARIGFESRFLDTATKPVVFGERPGDSNAPTILFYGHYDVQPADPLDAWDTPPFEPVFRDGRMIARGAQDNKGQHFYVLKALEHLIARDRLVLTVKVFIEGEEECGSPGITTAMQSWGDILDADILLVTDLGMSTPTTPTLTMGLRGLIHATVCLSGPRTDLHSGVHGGLAPNPATELCRMVGALHDAQGRIAIPGFYDGITPMSDAEIRLSESMEFDSARYASESGVAASGGEQALHPVQRLGMRPCLDINGIHSGFDGLGVKTIIPASACAKITARLAAGQDPQHCLDALVDFLRDAAPEALTLSIEEQGVGGSGLRLDPESDLIARGKRLLDGLTDNESIYRWEGASIPVIVDLATVSGAEPLMAGFGCEEDNIHAPNESFPLARFEMGYTFARRFFDSFGSG